MLRSLAISLSASQNGSSRLTLVLRPLMITERLMIALICCMFGRVCVSLPAYNHRFARRDTSSHAQKVVAELNIAVGKVAIFELTQRCDNLPPMQASILKRTALIKMRRKRRNPVQIRRQISGSGRQIQHTGANALERGPG